MTIPSDWRPTCSVTTLKARAQIVSDIRQFFVVRSVLEVETPSLSHFGATDIHLQQWQTTNGCFLHTSPEYAMKRLLASGSGDIFQICRVFREDEISARHNPEFTMLEWYRLGQDEKGLMNEVVDLIQSLSGGVNVKTQWITYRDAFVKVGLPDPFEASELELKLVVSERLNSSADLWSRDECLDALMALIVEPSLPKDELCFIYHYPESQAALAELSRELGYVTARRFELYWQGLELANGYYELTNFDEQLERFHKESELRKSEGKQVPELDENFLAAMKQGLPPCSGVALGVDRLIMILLEKARIEEVIAFPFDRA